jgi:uncharacterized protein YcbK (DUF882 family)
MRALRAGYCLGLSAAALVFGCTSLQTAVAEGDTRTISLHHMHTGEDLTITYKLNGRYDEAALQKLNWELRDWRRGEAIRMDPRLIDLVWDAQRDVGATQPIQIVCGYRAPQTNAMLHRRSSGVAQFSQHMLGKAMDFYIPGVPLAKLREAGLRLERGGVGYYPTSGSPFVHMDVGGIRYWPRMSREELVRIFPDQKTVYLPSDGRPLRNYALALAEVERRGSAPSQMSLAAARDAGMISGDAARATDSGSNLFAKLLGFGSKKDKDEDDADDADQAPRSVASTPPPRPTAVATVASDKDASVPLPRSKPVLAYQLASADGAGVLPAQAPSPSLAEQPAPTYQRPAADPTGGSPAQAQGPSLAQQPARAAARPAQAASLVGRTAASANDVISERGYWQGREDEPADAAPSTAPDAAAAMRTAMMRRGPLDPAAQADPETTATVAADAREAGASRLVLAYANVPGSQDAAAIARERPAARAPTATLTTATGATIAVKNGAAPPAPPPSRVGETDKAAALRAALLSGERFEEPWLRSMIVAPSSHRFLTTALLGPLDYHALTGFLAKPTSALAMTFGSGPTNFGAGSDRFAGSAVVFVSTITFSRHTASLR